MKLIISFFCLFVAVTADPVTTHTERSFFMIKPDGVQRGFVGAIIERFEDKGFKLVGMKFMMVTKAQMEEQYGDLSNNSWFTDFVTYMSHGPVVGMVFEGKDVVKTGRNMMGKTDPAEAAAGTIRGDFAVTIQRNMIHGSATVEEATKEIKMYFNDSEMFSYDQEYTNSLYA